MMERKRVDKITACTLTGQEKGGRKKIWESHETDSCGLEMMTDDGVPEKRLRQKEKRQ